LLLNSVRWSMCSCKGQNLRNCFTNCARRSPDNLPTDAGSIPAISTCESPGPDTDPGLFLVSGCVADRWLPAGRVRRASVSGAVTPSTGKLERLAKVAYKRVESARTDRSAEPDRPIGRGPRAPASEGS